MKAKFLALLLVAVTILTLFAGCAKDTPDPGTTDNDSNPSKNSITIGVSFATMQEEKWERCAENMQKKADERDDAEFENAVLDAVCENAKVDIPEAMIEDRIDERIREISMNMRYQGIDMQTYFKYTGTTEENLREQLKDQAKHDVLVRLVLEAVRDAEKVEADEASVNEEIDKYASQASGDAEKFKASLTDDDRKYFEEAVRMRKTVELLKDSAVAKAE